MYDESNNEYFETKIVLLSLPFHDCGDIVDLECTCGGVPKKDNSCNNHFCLHLSHTLTHLVDRTKKNSYGDGNPLIIIEKKDNGYVVNDVCIPCDKFPNDWPGATGMFSNRVTDGDIINYLKNIDICVLLIIKFDLGYSKSQKCVKCNRYDMYDVEQRGFVHKCCDYRVKLRKITNKSSILSRVQLSEFLTFAFYIFNSTLALNKAGNYANIKGSATVTRYKAFIYEVLSKIELFWKQHLVIEFRGMVLILEQKTNTVAENTIQNQCIYVYGI